MIHSPTVIGAILYPANGSLVSDILTSTLSVVFIVFRLNVLATPPAPALGAMFSRVDNKHGYGEIEMTMAHIMDDTMCLHIGFRWPLHQR